MMPRPPPPTLFPSTTLFRSSGELVALPCSVPRPNMPLYMAWRKDNDGKALAWFVERSEEHTSELQSREKLVCRLLLEKKKTPAGMRLRGRGADDHAGGGPRR